MNHSIDRAGGGRWRFRGPYEHTNLGTDGRELDAAGSARLRNPRPRAPRPPTERAPPTKVFLHLEVIAIGAHASAALGSNVPL